MLEQLPEFIDPLQCAEKRREFKGAMALSTMPRLIGAVAEASGNASVSMAFAKQGSLAVLEGHLSAVLHLTCQNCLETFAWPVDTDFKLGIVTSPDEVLLLPDAFEPLLVGEDKTPLRDIIEEELLLAIPAFPKHTEGNCFIDKTRFAAVPEREGAARPDNASPGLTAGSGLKPDNPFSVLAKLKPTGDS
jgi:uncharacterized protein